MVLEDCSTSQQLPASHSIPKHITAASSKSQHTQAHHSSFQQITAASSTSHSSFQRVTACPSTSQQLRASHSMSDDCCNLLEEYVRFRRQDVCRTGTRQVAYQSGHDCGTAYVATSLLNALYAWHKKAVLHQGGQLLWL